MLPEQDTIDVHEHTEEIERDEPQEADDTVETNEHDEITFCEKEKIYLTNKYIGVYKGKFGILTRKCEVPTRSELGKRQLEYQAKIYNMQKMAMENSPNKELKKTLSQRKLIRDSMKSEDIKGNIYDTINSVSIKSPIIENLKIDNTRKSFDNLHKMKISQNRSRKTLVFNFLTHSYQKTKTVEACI
jgi:hypothetical protein